MNELTMAERTRPFKEYLGFYGPASSGLNRYWSDVEAEISSEMFSSTNEYNEDHMKILQNHYKRFEKGFKNTQLGAEVYFDELIDNFEEYNLRKTYEISDIYAAQKCCMCEDYHNCWAKDFSYEDFIKKDGITEYGKQMHESCFDDILSNVIEWYWEYTANLVLHFVKDLGYSIPIDASNAATLVSNRDAGVLLFARKTVIFNDCQTILFPEFVTDFGIAGKSEMPLLLTG